MFWDRIIQIMNIWLVLIAVEAMRFWLNALVLKIFELLVVFLLELNISSILVDNIGIWSQILDSTFEYLESPKYVLYLHFFREL